MTLVLYNTLTRRKEPFRPLEPDHVRMYVCGPTVYDRAHVGNARPVLVFDVLARLLRRLYGRVTYARNITDVDDKINARARETGAVDPGDHRGDDGRLPTPTWPPSAPSPRTSSPGRASTSPGMIAMIEALLAQGHAYAADGHVLFHVPSWTAYGGCPGATGTG